MRMPRTRRASTWRAVALAALVGTGLSGAESAPTVPTGLDPLDPLVKAAAVNRRAAGAVLICAARAGERLVVAGESGTILYSDDQGKSWQQASVPVSVTLTGMHFASATQGWAVGHSGVVLHSGDGGRTWQLQLDATKLAAAKAGAPGGKAGQPSGQAIGGDPFLDVHFVDESNGLAVGAFGLIMRTHDGGRTWASAQANLPNPDGNHLYAVRAVAGSVFVVGERGAIYVSRDRGETFEALKSPYQGSFFGVIATPDEGVLIYGLRGHAFRSADQGRTWTEIEVGTGNAWLGATSTKDGRVVMVSQAGEVAVSVDQGNRFALLPERQPPLTAVIDAAQGGVVTAGMRGVGSVVLPARQGGAVQQ